MKTSARAIWTVCRDEDFCSSLDVNIWDWWKSHTCLTDGVVSPVCHLIGYVSQSIYFRSPRNMFTTRHYHNNLNLNLNLKLCDTASFFFFFLFSFWLLSIQLTIIQEPGRGRYFGCLLKYHWLSTFYMDVFSTTEAKEVILEMSFT